MIEYNVQWSGSSDDGDEGYLNRVMNILGELVIQKVRDNVRMMGLVSVGGGAYLQGWFSKFSGDTLEIDNTQHYAVFLEYGTYSYWAANGLDNFSDPLHAKKKDMDPKMRKMFPKGMQSFAPLRKVLFNQVIMEKLIEKAFTLASA